MLCALATLVTVPVLMSSGASSDGEEVALLAVPETVSASELEADVDIDELFDAGAKLDNVPQTPADDRGVSTAAVAVAAAPQALTLDELTQSRAEIVMVETPASSPDLATSTTASSDSASSASATPAPEPTTPPVVAEEPTTPPTTEEPPTTEAPSTTEPSEADPVVESPQSVDDSVEEVSSGPPTAEEWATLRECEASGDYSIVSGNGLYHGAYQFYQPTWDGLAGQLGRSDLVGIAPSAAAPTDQDALALLLWQQRGNQPWPHCGRHLPAAP